MEQIDEATTELELILQRRQKQRLAQLQAGAQQTDAGADAPGVDQVLGETPPSPGSGQPAETRDLAEALGLDATAPAAASMASPSTATPLQLLGGSGLSAALAGMPGLPSMPSALGPVPANLPSLGLPPFRSGSGGFAGAPAGQGTGSTSPELVDAGATPLQSTGNPATGAQPMPLLSYVESLVDGASASVSSSSSSSFGTASAGSSSFTAASATSSAALAGSTQSCPSFLFGSWLRLETAAAHSSSSSSSLLLRFSRGGMERIESTSTVTHTANAMRSPAAAVTAAAASASYRPPSRRSRNVEHQIWKASLRVRCTWIEDPEADYDRITAVAVNATHHSANTTAPAPTLPPLRLLSDFLGGLAVPAASRVEITVSIEGSDSAALAPMHFSFMQLRVKGKLHTALVERLALQADGTFEHGQAFLRVD